MPTIRDVARRAGVAPITVSRVVNNSGYVNKETRARVLAAIDELNYLPNTLARSLRSKRSQTLALVLSDITNPFWTTVARGVEDSASQAGFTVIFCNTDENEAKQEQYLQVVVQKQVDGILLVPASDDNQPIRWIQDLKIPLVVLDRRVSGVGVDCVRGDSLGGAYSLTKLLIECGCRRIAMLSGPENVSTSIDRVEGYRKALKEHGSLGTQELVYFGKYTRQSGMEMASQALSLNPRPEALFAGNNFIADGAMEAITQADLRIPAELDMVVFDKMPYSWSPTPYLATAEQPAYEMGKQATMLLMARLLGQNLEQSQDVVLPVKITYRKTMED